MLFNLDFPSNTTLWCFCFFLLTINFYCLISAVIAQAFNPIAERVIPFGILTEEAKGEIETQPVIVEA